MKIFRQYVIARSRVISKQASGFLQRSSLREQELDMSEMAIFL